MSLVKIGVVRGTAAEIKTDLLAVVAHTDDLDKGGKLKSALLKDLDTRLGVLLAQAAADAEFEGKPNTEISLYTAGKLAAPRLVILGCGPSDKMDKDAARQAGSRAVKAGEKARVKKVSLMGPFGGVDNVEAVAEGAQLGAYRFDRYMSEKKPLKTEALDLVVESAPNKAQKAAALLGTELGASVNLARDLVNEPPNVLSPEALAAHAETVAAEGGLKITCYDRKGIEKLGMRMFVGVTQGSNVAPRLIHMVYEPADLKARKQKPVVLVGKGLTFDSGGLSLKPADGMMTMKCDMGGAAAVVGAMRAISRLRPNVPVHGFIGACENMPSGTAQRPGDVVKARNGKTVEVLNTDAEGRLVLGDVLSWAVDHDPACIVDLATLTGACVMALGPYMSALYSTDEALAQQLLDGAKRAGEEFWRMPLAENLKELIKSQVADMKNIGARGGGSITAALFLKEFVGKVPWAHLDIAGAAFLDKARGYDAAGGTGHGVRTLVEMVRARAR